MITVIFNILFFLIVQQFKFVSYVFLIAMIKILGSSIVKISISALLSLLFKGYYVVSTNSVITETYIPYKLINIKQF